MAKHDTLPNDFECVKYWQVTCTERIGYTLFVLSCAANCDDASHISGC